jgi:hypothetical protein
MLDDIFSDLPDIIVPLRRKRSPAPPRAVVVQRIRSKPIYLLRRPDGSDLCISRHLLACLYDLSVAQLCVILRISLTTAKKIRGWAGLQCWPRVDIVASRHTEHTLDSVSQQRVQMMGWARENSVLDAFDVLARAHLAVYPDAFDPLSSVVLDQLDAPGRGVSVNK